MKWWCLFIKQSSDWTIKNRNLWKILLWLRHNIQLININYAHIYIFIIWHGHFTGINMTRSRMKKYSPPYGKIDRDWINFWRIWSIIYMTSISWHKTPCTQYWVRGGMEQNIHMYLWTKHWIQSTWKHLHFIKQQNHKLVVHQRGIILTSIASLAHSNKLHHVISKS